MADRFNPDGTAPILVRVLDTSTNRVRFVVLDHPDMLAGVFSHLERPGQPICTIATVQLDASLNSQSPWILREAIVADSRVRKLARLLKARQWTSVHDDCDSCGNQSEQGHAADCELAAALREAEEVASG